ncbi:MAG: IS200/IS605 family transposase [Dehalococcoidia bacterium]|nr:IS200/IS605 family transposase [Dehalococcoidia bacterium]|tara:strand:+ start:140 stop:568 length:429 start_codon:yes stop_codon:yes gene_type:complete
MRRYRKGSHSTHDLKVHLVWCTKYRHKALQQDVACRIRDLLRQICEANDIQIVKGHVSKDHIHLYVSYPPKLSVSEMIKRLKGRSSKMIQAEFPEVGAKFWGRHFWGIGYAAFSSGTVTDQTIQEYLERHIDKDDGFTVDGE